MLPYIELNGVSAQTPCCALTQQSRGAAIDNEGGVIDFNAGSQFERNFADGSGDGGDGGAIYNTNGGVITWVPALDIVLPYPRH